MPPSISAEEKPASVGDLRRLENKVDDVVKLLADMKLYEERQQNMNTRLTAVEQETKNNTKKVDRGIWIGTGMYLAGGFVMWLLLQGVITVAPAHKLPNPPTIADVNKDPKS